MICSRKGAYVYRNYRRNRYRSVQGSAIRESANHWRQKGTGRYEDRGQYLHQRRVLNRNLFNRGLLYRRRDGGNHAPHKLGSLTPGSPVNLERAHACRMDASGRSHCEPATSTAPERITQHGAGRQRHLGDRIRARRQSILRYIIEKGSIAIDGISLTVARLRRETGFQRIQSFPTPAARHHSAPAQSGRCV